MWDGAGQSAVPNATTRIGFFRSSAYKELTKGAPAGFKPVLIPVLPPYFIPQI